MPKPNLQELAKVGARARLTEIQDERSALLAMFPELRAGRAPKATAAAPPVKGRKRRTMTAAGRKAVGERMKAYWAAKRAANNAQGEQGPTHGSPSLKSGRRAGRRQGRKK